MVLWHRKKETKGSYDRERLEPAIRCSICTGEQVAGFLSRETGKFEEVTLLRSGEDLQAFRDRYGITEEIRRIY